MGPKTVLERAAGSTAALEAKKPLALLVLADDDLRSHTLLRLLSDPGVGDALDKVVWAKRPWAKDDDELKRWKVAAPGAVVLLDPTSDPPRLIKVLRAAAPATLRKELLAAK